MKLLAFSDWRIHSIDNINSEIFKHRPDAILYCGDDLERVIPVSNSVFLRTDNLIIELEQNIDKDHFVFEDDCRLEFFSDILSIQQKKPIEHINTLGIPLFYVNGNDDNIFENNGDYFIDRSRYFALKYFLRLDEENKISVLKSDYPTVSVDIQLICKLEISPCFRKQQILNGPLIYGSRCGNGFTDSVWNLPDYYVDILLVHIPPIGCLDLSIRHGVKHIGSLDVLTYIEKYQPKYVVCGHSHFWGGKTSKIGKTEIINISSNDNIGSSGNYALIDSEKNTVSLNRIIDSTSSNKKTLIQIRGAKFLSNLNDEIYGSCIKTYEKYNRKSIDNHYAISYYILEEHNLLLNDNEEIIDALKKHKKHLLIERIQSLKLNKPKITKKLSFNPDEVTMIDVETGIPKFSFPKQVKCKLWLLGFLHKGIVYQFEFPKQSKAIEKFIQENNISELTSWTSYDSLVLKNYRIFRKMKWIDACKRVANCVKWHSFRLHDLYDTMFDNVDEDIIDGSLAGAYADHLINKKEKCKFCPPLDEIKNLIKDRNKKDLIQMHELCTRIWNYKSK